MLTTQAACRSHMKTVRFRVGINRSRACAQVTAKSADAVLRAITIQLATHRGLKGRNAISVKISRIRPGMTLSFRKTKHKLNKPASFLAVQKPNRLMQRLSNQEKATDALYSDYLVPLKLIIL